MTITDQFAEYFIQSLKGGPGSGNFGHSGRPGKHGGSAPQSSAFTDAAAGESYDKVKYARLQAGFEKRGRQAAERFKSELRANPEFMAAQEKVKAGRAKVVETQSRAEKAKAATRTVSVEDQIKAIKKQGTDLRKELAQRKAEKDTASAKKREIYIEQKASLDDPKYLEAQSEYDAKSDAYYKKFFEYEDYKRNLKSKLAHIKLDANTPKTDDAKAADLDAIKAEVEYKIISETDGRRALEIAMDAAAKARDRAMPQKATGAIGKFREENQREAKALIPIVQKYIDRGIAGLSDKEYDEYMEMHTKLSELTDRTYAIDNIMKGGDSFLDHGSPGNAHPESPSNINSSVADGFTVFNKVAGSNPLMERTSVIVKAITGRASANADGTQINISKHDSAGVVAHELGHILEDRDPLVRQSAKAFLSSRTGGESQRPLKQITGNRAYGSSEYAKQDKFINAYMGKIYDHGSTEIVSMGMGQFATSAGRWELATKDPEYFDFMYALLHIGRV
jgi:hypothetical protein